MANIFRAGIRSPQDLFLWCEAFLQPALEVDILVAAFGVAPTGQRGEDLDLFPPQDTNLEQLTIEVLHGGLAGLRALLTTPIHLSLADLLDRFGEPRSFIFGPPRYQHETLNYQLTGNDHYAGQLLAEIEGDMSQTTNLTIRRFSLTP